MWDITLPISEEMPLWPGSTAPLQEWTERLEDGDTSNVSRWLLDSHTGTHLDAPSHFLPEGRDLESIPLDVLVGRCVVLDLVDLVHDITAEDLILRFAQG